MRECTICGCDITALHPTRKRCDKVSCADAQKKIANAKGNRSHATAKQRQRNSGDVYEISPLQMHTPKTIRSSGGLNISRDVLDQHRSEEWARATGKGDGK